MQIGPELLDTRNLRDQFSAIVFESAVDLRYAVGFNDPKLNSWTSKRIAERFDDFCADNDLSSSRASQLKLLHDSQLRTEHKYATGYRLKPNELKRYQINPRSALSKIILGKADQLEVKLDQLLDNYKEEKAKAIAQAILLIPTQLIFVKFFLYNQTRARAEKLIAQAPLNEVEKEVVSAIFESDLANS
ncbi:MAG: hypothetical protein OXU45_06785 [Candidatus Melainabacteria bacterium]|nr:hypothetical protein [Candidatus Melainabacteria bacterium]